MNLGGIRGLVLQRLDEDPTLTVAGSWTAAEVNAGINEGQMLLVLMTLCLETTVTFALSSSWNYDPFAQFADWILPLRVRTSGGAKVRPARFSDLDALDSAWRGKPGSPTHYGTSGWSNLYFYPAAAGTVSIVYANSPALLVADTDIPQAPEQHHPALADFAVYWLRQKLGGAEFQKGLAFLGRFFESAKELSAFTRARALGQRYDTVPIELKRLDLSRMLKIRKDLLPIAKELAL